MDRKLQRHRADSLRQHGFLVYVMNIFIITQYSANQLFWFTSWA